MNAPFSISFPLGVFQEPGASWQAHAPVGGRPPGSEKEPWQGKVRSESQPHLSELQELGHHDGVITHLEPDILECDVKWALGSITKQS